MKRVRLSSALTAAWIGAMGILQAQRPSSPAFPRDPEIEVVQVAEGAYAVLRSQHPDEQPGHSNSVIIINDDDVVVVDATRMPSQARKILGVVRSLTDKPVRTLIHTHWHDDHVYGDQAFAEAFPAIEIIAQRNARAAILPTPLPPT